MYSEKFNSIIDFIECYMPERLYAWQSISSEEYEELNEIYLRKTVDDFKKAEILMFSPPAEDSNEYKELILYFENDLSVLEFVQNKPLFAQDIYICLKINNEGSNRIIINARDLERGEEIRLGYDYRKAYCNDSNQTLSLLEDRFTKIKETYIPKEVKSYKKESIYKHYIKTSGSCYPNYGPRLNGEMKFDPTCGVSFYSNFNNTMDFDSTDIVYLPEFIRQRNKYLLHDSALLKIKNRKATHQFADQVPSIMNNTHFCSLYFDEIKIYYCEHARYVICKNNYSGSTFCKYYNKEFTIEMNIKTNKPCFQAEIKYIIPIEDFDEKSQEIDEQLKQLKGGK